jgi:hypothetical protein
MSLVTCYDADGLPREKEPVDARECCLYCGFTMTPPGHAVAIVGDSVQTLPDVPDSPAEQPAAAPEKRPYHRKPKA